MNKKVVSILRSYAFLGVVLICIGVAMIVWPASALKTVFIVAGVALALVGLIKGILYFVGKGADRNLGDLLIGIFLFAAGLALSIKADFFISFFNYVTGALLVVGALLLFRRAYRLRAFRGAIFKLSLVFGIIMAILAALIIWNPSFLTDIIMYFYGAALIIEGLSMIIALREGKKKQ